MSYSELFWGFLRVGLFSFGGAYGAISLIREVVLSYGWLDDEMLAYMIAVSESTPGPIMVNLATYVGGSQQGLLGAALATAAVVLPSFLIMLLLMAILKNAVRNNRVQAVLQGVKSSMIGIILATGIFMLLKSCTSGYKPDMKRIVVTIALLVFLYGSRGTLKKKISPILLVVASAGIGVAVF